MFRNRRDVVVSVFHKYAKALRENRQRKEFKRATGEELSTERIAEQFPRLSEMVCFYTAKVVHSMAGPHKTWV